jgi:signal transduction histidine kinase
MNSAKKNSKNYFLHERIFTERAFSVTTYLTVGIPAGVLKVVADPAMASNDFFTWFGVVTVSTLLAGLFFGVFGSLLFKRSKGITRIVLGFFGFAITGALRGGLLGFIGLETGALDEVNWQFRFVGGAVVATVLFPLAAILFNDFVAYSSRFSELTQIQKQLATLRTNIQVELDSKRALLEAGINDRLTEVIDSLSSEALQGKSADEFKQLTKSLQSAVESVVRPMSKELLAEDSAIENFVNNQGLHRVNFKSWLESTTVAKPFSPWPVALIWSVIGASTISALRPGFPGVLAFPLYVLSTWALLLVAQRWIAPNLPRFSQTFRIYIILGWYVIASVIPAALSWPPLANIDRPGFASLKTTLLVLDPIANIILCITLALLAGLNAERTRVLNEIVDVNQNLRWELASLQGQLQIHRKQLARRIHNDVQAVFIASAMKLQNAINNGEVSQSLISEITQSLREIEVVYSDTKQVPSLTKAMDDLKSFWGNGVSINCDFDSSTEKLLMENEILRTTLIEVCSEAVINAVKHASATQIDINLSPNESVLNVNVLNNGEPLRPQFVEGSGLQMTKEVSVTCEIRKASKGTLLTVALPITRIEHQ